LLQIVDSYTSAQPTFLAIMWSLRLLGEEEITDLVVENQDESTACPAENVGESSLEEGPRSLVLGNLAPAVNCSLVSSVSDSPARLHHNTTTNGVEGIGDNPGHGGDGLGNGEGDDEGRVPGVREHALGCVEEPKVRSTIDDDALDRHAEPTVETHNPVRLEDLGKTVSESAELSLGSGFPNISSQSCTSEVKRVHKAETSGPSSTTRSQVSNEVTAELGVLVYAAQENLLVFVLEGEVECLSWEVTDDVGHVTSPEGQESLLLGNTDEAVHHSLVALGLCDLL